MEELDIVSLCRYEEIIANIARQIELSGCKDRLAAGCVLTGGASLQNGLNSLIREKLGISRIMARGFSGICFGLSDRKPQFSSLTTMISLCTADCESKPVIEQPKPVIQPSTVKPTVQEQKNSEKANETKKHQESTPKASRRPGIGSFFRDLFSGIDE